jgi:hypothetical protein
MVTSDEQFRPYAATANVIAVINRAKTRNLPETINNEFLRIVGVPEVVFGRVMQALRFLNLVHEDGRPTEILEALASSPEAEYHEILEKAVREAYRTEFNVIDPGQDPQSRILDAFAPYKPRSQTSRMVMLFLGLCREAGIPVLEAPRERSMKAEPVRRAKTPRQKRSTTRGAEDIVGQVGVRAIARPVSSVMFGVTEDDIGALSEEEFQEVWSALGVVARARARAKKESIKEPEEEPEKPKEE